MTRIVLIVAGILVIVLGIAASSALYTVKETEQALVLQFGEYKYTIDTPGLHAKLPFVQNAVLFDKRVLDFDAPAEEVLGSDQKRLVVDAYVRFRITDPLAFYKTVATETGAEARLSTFVSGSLRRVFGNVTLDTVLSRDRADIMNQIKILVDAQVRDFGMVVVDVRLRRVDLPEANSQAIYARMQSERERIARETRAKGAEESQRVRSRADRERTVILAEADKRSQILRGEGDGNAVRIYAEAYNKGREFFDFYRSLAAYRKILKSEDTMLVLSPDSEFFRYFKNVPGGKSLSK